MAKVKINDSQFSEIETNLLKAMEVIQETQELWGTNFDNLYYRFVTSGFLDDLYNDAISSYHTWSRGLSAISNVVSCTALGLSVGSWVGGIIGLVIGVIWGVSTFCKGDPEWITVSRDVFKQMLENCMYGIDDAYIYMENTKTKLYNCQLALQRVRTRINDFNKYGANFSEAASQYDLNLRTGGADGLTILGVETEVVIDGQTITMDTSEAMSAFYTYAYTVTGSVIAADYLERTYGYEIDFLDLVANANAFMSDTIQSDLYTPEMINAILPQYTPSEQAAYDAVSASTGLSIEELKAAMGDIASIGTNPLFAGIIGAGFIGSINEEKPKDDGEDPGTEKVCPVCKKNPCKCPNPSTNPGGNGQNGYPTPDTTPEDTPSNEVVIDKIVEITVPVEEDIEVELGVVTEDGEIDYDQLAYEEYQFETSVEEIEAYRLKVMQEVDELYSSGQYTEISKQLQDYGYETAEIATILSSKAMTIKAIMDGNTRAILAQKAAEMAKADGAENYNSRYSNPPSTDELSDTKKPLRTLHINSDNKELVDMEEELDVLEESYRAKVDEANKLLDEAKINKDAVDAIREKYVEKYGEDTSKWTEEAAKEYSEAVDKYNESANKANEAVTAADNAKTEYQNSREEFEKACEDYYKSKIVTEDEEQVIVDNEGIVGIPPQTEGTTNSGQNSSTPDSGLTFNEDGTISVGNSNNNNSNNSDNLNNSDGSSDLDSSNDSDMSGSTNGSGLTFNEDGTISIGSTNNAGSNVVDINNSSAVDTSSSNGTFVSQDDFLAALGLKSKDKDNN